MVAEELKARPTAQVGDRRGVQHEKRRVARASNLSQGIITGFRPEFRRSLGTPIHAGGDRVHNRCSAVESVIPPPITTLDRKARQSAKECGSVTEKRMARQVAKDEAHSATTKTARLASPLSSWDQRFKGLDQFKKEHGHCNVPPVMVIYSFVRMLDFLPPLALPAHCDRVGCLRDRSFVPAGLSRCGSAHEFTPKQERLRAPREAVQPYFPI